MQYIFSIYERLRWEIQIVNGYEEEFVCNQFEWIESRNSSVVSCNLKSLNYWYHTFKYYRGADRKASRWCCVLWHRQRLDSTVVKHQEKDPHFPAYPVAVSSWLSSCLKESLISTARLMMMLSNWTVQQMLQDRRHTSAGSLTTFR